MGRGLSRVLLFWASNVTQEEIKDNDLSVQDGVLMLTQEALFFTEPAPQPLFVSLINV